MYNSFIERENYMNELQTNYFKDCCQSILSQVDKELMDMTSQELDKYWFFKWDSTKSMEWNVYQFQDLINLYNHKCERWEEIHNGRCCVVGRVRDKYLMPKIKEFCDLMKGLK